MTIRSGAQSSIIKIAGTRFQSIGRRLLSSVVGGSDDCVQELSSLEFLDPMNLKSSRRWMKPLLVPTVISQDEKPSERGLQSGEFQNEEIIAILVNQEHQKLNEAERQHPGQMGHTADVPTSAVEHMQMESSRAATEYTIYLEHRSRFVMHLLLDQYHFGGGSHSRGYYGNMVDRANTKTCHAVMDHLATDKDSSRTKKTMTTAQQQAMWKSRAERADLILQCMELFRHKLKASSSAETTRLKMEYPLPTADTYWKVLNIYAMAGTPQESRAVLNRMREVSSSSLSFSSAMASDSMTMWSLTTALTTSHWNQVISAHAVDFRNPKRAVEAAELLQEMRENDVDVDGQSYANVLRACCYSNNVSNAKNKDEAGAPMAPENGSVLAALIMNNYLENRYPTEAADGTAKSPRLVGNSYLYAFFFRSQRLIHNQLPKQSEANIKHSTNTELLARAFQACCKEGVLNNHVLQAFLEVAPRGLIEKLVGGLPPTNNTAACSKILMSLPPEWSRHSVTQNQWGW